jgi:hypothetical protein
MNTKFTPEEIIESLQGVRRAEPRPFLHTRIIARMTKEETGGFGLIFRVISAPAFSLAMAILFIIINGYFMVKNTEQQIDSDDFNQGLAAEYNQHALNPYEIPK